MKGARIFLICVMLMLAVIVLAQQNPSYRSFNPGQFETNATPWPIALKTNLTLTNLSVSSNLFISDIFFATNVTTIQSNLIVNGNVFVSNNIIFQGVNLDPLKLWLPSAEYILWYEPFSGSANLSGTIGKMGWTAVSAGSGGIGIANSNALGHFGTITLLTRNDAANSIEQIFLGDVVAGQPPVPILTNAIGWTNRFIWRITGSTNAFRSYIHFGGQGAESAVPIENGVGIMINSTNSNNVQGFCSNASVQTRTNLGVYALDTWITNQVWCRIPGVISFNMGTGPECFVTNNIPTHGLTPRCSVMTTGVGTSATLEVDEWVMWLKLP